MLFQNQSSSTSKQDIKQDKYLHRNTWLTRVHHRYVWIFYIVPGPRLRCKKTRALTLIKHQSLPITQKKGSYLRFDHKTHILELVKIRKNIYIFYLIFLHMFFLGHHFFLWNRPIFFPFCPPHPPLKTVTLKLPLLSDAKYLAFQAASSAMRCLPGVSAGHGVMICHDIT